MERKRRLMRDLGFLLALSTPITAFISFAIFSVIFGESRFEDEVGTTELGYLVMALPLLAGLCLAAWAHFDGRTPSRRLALALAVAVSVFCIVVGFRSSTNSGDASIGGGLLVLFGLLVGASTVVIWFTTVREQKEHAE